MRNLLASVGLALLIGASPALAAPAATVNLAAPTGTVGMGSDGGGNLLPVGALCGAASSAVWAACTFQVIVNSSGQLSVTGPVTNAGTFAVQAAQSGTWTVQPGNTANTVPWLVTGAGGTFPVTGTFWQATQPISAASLPLPAGSATQTTLAAVLSALGSPMQATGGTVTANLGTLNGAATQTTLAAILSALGSPLQAGGNINIASCAAGVCGLPTVTTNALVQGRISTPMTGTTATSLIAAVTSQHLYVTSAFCKNTSAVATLVNLTDGSGGTVLAQIAAGATYGGDNLAAGSVPLFWTTAGNALFAVDVTTGASVTCNASGYSSAS